MKPASPSPYLEVPLWVRLLALAVLILGGLALFSSQGVSGLFSTGFLFLVVMFPTGLNYFFQGGLDAESAVGLGWLLYIGLVWYFLITSKRRWVILTGAILSLIFLLNLQGCSNSMSTFH